MHPRRVTQTKTTSLNVHTNEVHENEALKVVKAWMAEWSRPWCTWGGHSRGREWHTWRLAGHMACFRIPGPGNVKNRSRCWSEKARRVCLWRRSEILDVNLEWKFYNQGSRSLQSFAFFRCRMHFSRITASLYAKWQQIKQVMPYWWMPHHSTLDLLANLVSFQPFKFKFK